MKRMGTADPNRAFSRVPSGPRTRRRHRAAHLFRIGLVLLLALLPTGCSDPVESSASEPPESPGGDPDFEAGSGIDQRIPTAPQVENLALLGKVWGFVKYHHPAVAAGLHNWDYELFRVVPTVLAASNRAAAADAIVTWLDGLGAVQPCGPCATEPASPHMRANTAWLSDVGLLGSQLSQRLQTIYVNRPAAGAHRYVSFVEGAGNPDFSGEARYEAHSAPDAGYRLLALFRFWNIIEYWYPYRDVTGEDWDAVLEEYIPVVLEPLNGDAYRLAMLRLTARVHDTHANLWGELHLQPPTGNEALPVVLRFVNGTLVVTGYSDAERGAATGLAVGDEIHEIDGVSVSTLVDSLRSYYPASNEAGQLRDMARKLTRGQGAITLSGVRASGGFTVSANRVPVSSIDASVGRWHDLPGPTFRLLTEEVAYLKLSSVVAADAAEYVSQAEGTEVFVIDIRNYPSDFAVYSLGGYLVDGAVPFAAITRPDPANPGAFVWEDLQVQTPHEPRYTGKVVILVDEVSQSAAEYTAMAFRVAPGAIVVGSTTAGADGNISPIPLPGNTDSMMSGIGVFSPDRTPTQRVGIVPDLVVVPTVEGIREGRDEVLEAGVSAALGRTFTLPPG